MRIADGNVRVFAPRFPGMAASVRPAPAGWRPERVAGTMHTVDASPRALHLPRAMDHDSSVPPARRRPRHPPPPLTRPVRGPLLPHAEVLDELVSPVGVLLWQLLRDATLWSTAEREHRAGLFADAARASGGAVPEVQEELDALAVLVRDPHPDAGPIIARMCDRVRTWAEGRGTYATALAFAQAAALAHPEDARCAYEVGRLARCRAEYARAEVWYQRALVLGRRSGDREVQARSYGGLANLYARRGNYPLAFEATGKMVRLAKRHALPDVLSGALHGWAVLCFETGEIEAGIRHARRALRVRGAADDSTLRIAHDMAVALMDHCGAFGLAREVLRTLLPHVVQARVRWIVLANLGRAAAASGDLQLFEAAWTETWAVLGSSADPGDTDALIALAHGAASLRNWERARAAATRAHALAMQRGEGRLIHLTEALLGGIESEQQVYVRVERKNPGVETSTVTSFGRDLLQVLQVQTPLADELLEKLQSVLDHPGNATKAYEFGRALRLRGDVERARAWLQRGLNLARESGDVAAESLCLGGLGNLHAQQGAFDSAIECHRRRLDHAVTAGLKQMEGDALLDLCAVSFATDQGDTGLEYARRALDVIGPDNPALPRLAHDLGVYLMERRGDFENAYLLFDALRRRDLPLAETLLLQASLARAAAGSGYAQPFEDAWTAAWSTVDRLEDAECPAGAFIHLAHGAMSRGRYDLAERAASRAQIAARLRGESPILGMAEGLLEAARSGRGVSGRAPAWRDPSHDARTASRLTRGFVTAIRSGVAQSVGATRTRVVPFGSNPEEGAP